MVQISCSRFCQPMMLLCTGVITCFFKVGTAFVQKSVKLFTAYGEGSTMECIVLKADLVLCSLFLQRPHWSARTRDFIVCLECHLEL